LHGVIHLVSFSYAAREDSSGVPTPAVGRVLRATESQRAVWTGNIDDDDTMIEDEEEEEAPQSRPRLELLGSESVRDIIERLGLDGDCSPSSVATSVENDTGIHELLSEVEKKVCPSKKRIPGFFDYAGRIELAVDAKPSARAVAYLCI
jgi:hypothetical protein